MEFALYKQADGRIILSSDTTFPEKCEFLKMLTGKYYSDACDKVRYGYKHIPGYGYYEG